LQGITETFERVVADEVAVLVVEVSVGTEELFDRRTPDCAV
jgi:hypothetical protein